MAAPKIQPTPELPYLLVYQRHEGPLDGGRVATVRRVFATNEEAVAAAAEVHPFDRDGRVMPQLAASVVAHIDRGRVEYNQGIWTDAQARNRYAVIFRLLHSWEERD